MAECDTVSNLQYIYRQNDEQARKVSRRQTVLKYSPVALCVANAKRRQCVTLKCSSEQPCISFIKCICYKD